ncbi:exodeoxyribonuclease V subunit alpha [Chitinimonas sp.]|uniref:exodeoxyribonuclease V subunit alpha n=1 Tax=Chitinimonas sp. TaxID=1934313 RepID=UPI0035ADAF40
MNYSPLSALTVELCDWLHQRFPTAPASAHAAASLCAQRASEGHVCINLAQEAGTNWQGETLPELADWLDALDPCPFIARAGGFAPLIRDGDRLYLGRLWADEVALAAALLARAGSSKHDEATIHAALAPWFGDGAADQSQRQAAAIALGHRIAVIAGGPGTGKTTTVAKLLAAQASLSPGLRIQLAAPTGKAAARMVEALEGAKARLGLDLATQAALPDSATTLHRLLGFRPDSATPRHGPDNPLALDLVVVDEASMIDQALFTSLLAALPARAQLILLGDPHQLASVQAGSIFSELVSLADSGPASPLAAGIARLTVSHRFGGAIGELAGLSLRGEVAAALNLLKAAPDGLRWQAGRMAQWQAELLAQLATALPGYRQAVSASQPDEAWQHFNRLRLLCALREGPCGVDAINRLIEQQLWRDAQRHDARHAPWYAGRPVIIRSNAPALGLANGDIGLTLATAEGLRVFFPSGTGWRALAPGRLPAHDTAFALTVHQAQGSEFDAIWLLLPDDDAAVLNRNLIYTALTRARKQVWLWGSASTLATALERNPRRESGLAARLIGTPAHL